MTPDTLRDDCGSRPCPACAATGTDYDGSAPCRACDGTRWYPYPWELPEDAETFGRATYTADEDAIITAAPSNLLAYIGYVTIYGACRSYRAIAKHRCYRRHHPAWRPAWSDAMEDVLDDSRTPAEAVTALSAAMPEGSAPSPEAIVRKWYRLHLMDGSTRGP
jgi:hypothetical protein